MMIMSSAKRNAKFAKVLFALVTTATLFSAVQSETYEISLWFGISLFFILTTNVAVIRDFTSRFLIFLTRPFSVGDEVDAGGTVGKVLEIGMLRTSIASADNSVFFISNSTIMNSTIRNFSVLEFRRIELSFSVSIEKNDLAIIALTKQKLKKIPEILEHPEPEVRIFEICAGQLFMEVRVCCYNECYWSVFFDAQKTVRELLACSSQNRIINFPNP
jgi:small conductance mechanosensitive channel